MSSFSESFIDFGGILETHAEKPFIPFIPYLA